MTQCTQFFYECDGPMVDTSKRISEIYSVCQCDGKCLKHEKTQIHNF